MNFAIIIIITFLTEMGMPLSAWLSIIITAMLAVLGFLLIGAYSRVQEDIDENRKDIVNMREDFNREKLNTANGMKDMKITILESLNDIKRDFYELRK